MDSAFRKRKARLKSRHLLKGKGGAMRSLILAFLVLISMSTPVLASELSIRTMNFRLGSDETAVMDEVQSHFQVVPIKNGPKSFVLYAKPPDNIIPLGTISFVNNRLSSIERNWGFFEGTITSTKVMKALFAALESAMASEGTSPKISTEVNRAPGIEFRSINFNFPGRIITVGSEEWVAKEGRQLLSIAESVSLGR